MTGAEVLYAVREEMAITLGDALLRRTEAGSRGHPGHDAVEQAASLMGDALGWSASTRLRETQAFARVYDAATIPGS